MTSSAVQDSIESIIKYCIDEMLSAQSIDTIMDSSKVIDLVLDKVQTENKKIMNMIINEEVTAINPIIEEEFSQHKGIVKKKIGEAMVKKIIEVIPSKYSKYLSDDLDKINKTILQFLKDPRNLTSDFTKQKLDEFLERLENPFVDITADKLEVITKRNHQQLECDFNFKIKKGAQQPIAKVKATPELGQNPLLKMKFKIDGDINFSGMTFSHLEDFKISFDEVDANLTIAIQEIQLMKTALINEENKTLHTVSLKKVKGKFPEIIIKDN